MNKIQISDQQIYIIASPDDKAFQEACAANLGIYSTRKHDTYVTSLRNLPEILCIMRHIITREQVPDSILPFYDYEIMRRQATYSLLCTGPVYKHKFLWEHQELGVELAAYNKRYNFFYDTRTGKTLMALQVMANALQSGRAKRCLVLCPSSIIPSWTSDIQKFFPQLKFAVYSGTPKDRETALRTPAHIVVWSTNIIYNSFELIKKVPFDICFFDESSKLKNHKSQLSKMALELSPLIPSWYNLSATPAPNGEHEYYTQMRIIDPCSFNPSRSGFVKKYFNDVSRDPAYEKLKLRDDMRDEFTRIVHEHSIYVDHTAMPVPEKQWHTVEFELDDESKKIYDDMRIDMAATIQGDEMTVLQATSVRSKLNQIASGFIIDSEKRKDNIVNRKLKIDEIEQDTVAFSNSRIAALNTVLTTIGGKKCVIWANYIQEFAMIKALLGSRAKYLNGQTTTEEKYSAIQEFKKGALQYLVCHPASVGMGINLTEACNAIYYSLNDSWELFKQSSERIFGHILVQPNVCHYWVIVAKDTVNGLVYKNIMDKRDASVGLLEHLRGGKVDLND